MKFKRCTSLLLACLMLCSCAPKTSMDKATEDSYAATLAGESMLQDTISSYGTSLAFQEVSNVTKKNAIYGVYAQEIEDMVEFTVEYKAQQGAKLHLSADNLYYDGDFETTGKQDCFVFRISDEDAEKLDMFSVTFIHEDLEVYRAEVDCGVQVIEAQNLPEREGTMPKLIGITQIQPESTQTATELKATWAYVDRDNDPDNVSIYNFAAWELSTGVVRCMVDYAAPNGTKLTVYGNNLIYRSSFLATGGRDRFVFDLDADASKKIRTVNVEFGDYPEGMFLIGFTLHWPEEGMTDFSLPLLSDGTPVGETADLRLEKAEGVTVTQFNRQWLDNQCFRYTLVLTAPKGLTMHITGADGQVYYDPVQTTGESMTVVFDLPWAVAALSPNIQVDFRNEAEENAGAVTAVNGLLVTGETEQSEGYALGARVDTDWFHYNVTTNTTVQVHNCTKWELSQGYSRYRVEFTAPEGMRVWTRIGADPDEHIENDRFLMDSGIITNGQKQSIVFDLKDDSLKNVFPVVSFHHPDMNAEYMSIFESDDMQLSDGKPIGEKTELKYIGNNFRTRNDLTIYQLYAQTLDNEMVRITLEYAGAKGITIKWDCDNATGDDDYYTIITDEEKQELVFDLSFEQLREYYGLMVVFCDEYKARFVLPSVMNFDDFGVSSAETGAFTLTEVEFNGKYTDLGAREYNPDQSQKSRTLLEEIVQKIEELVQKHFPAPEQEEPVASVDTSCVQPLKVSRKLTAIRGQDGIEPYSEINLGAVIAGKDFTDNPALAYSLSMYDGVLLPDGMPASYDSEALTQWGKNPGLNVDVLHELGYTGKGAVIAYVDQPAADHPQYTKDNLHYTNHTTTEYTMHGPAVLSLLMGKDIGTAPDAEVYYYGHAAWVANQKTHADCLYQIIEQNKALPEGKKITMVGFSDNIDETEKNAQALRDAVKACEEAGIMVWFCGEYMAAAFLPMSDRDNIDNVIRDAQYGGYTPTLVHVPAGSRTTATNESGEYIYWASGGLSWTMPYVLGIYSIVKEIDPSLTQADLRRMVVNTAYRKDGMKVINPVEFVAAALDGVGRTEDAEELRNAAAANTKYMYAVMNKGSMSKEDITAAENYLKQIADASVLVVDSSKITSAQQLYTVLQADHAKRGGKITGIQIFGDAQLVPSFEVGYKVQLANGVDDMGTLLTDLFYGNLNNDAKQLTKAYNVMDHFADGWNVQLTPQWKVVRLPLGKGEFKAFFEKYFAFAENGGLTEVPIANFSSPIFPDPSHLDDMGYFLNRMEKELYLLDIPYKLYGNQRGQYPVTTQVLGDFTAENLTAENKAEIQEFIINGHGQWNNIDRCWFESNKEMRESLVNMSNINTVLGHNPYYLDCWTCDNGYGMKNNLTTTALKGQCVGVFSTTHLISNNGVDCYPSMETMPNSNFYYFYLHYLKELSDGASRSDAFWTAQKHYANALLADSLNGISDLRGHYQFNLCNLLAYHNFGVIEPNRAYLSMESNIVS